MSKLRSKYQNHPTFTEGGDIFLDFASTLGDQTKDLKAVSEANTKTITTLVSNQNKANRLQASAYFKKSEENHAQSMANFAEQKKTLDEQREALEDQRKEFAEHRAEYQSDIKKIMDTLEKQGAEKKYMALTPGDAKRLFSRPPSNIVVDESTVDTAGMTSSSSSAARQSILEKENRKLEEKTQSLEGKLRPFVAPNKAPEFVNPVEFPFSEKTAASVNDAVVRAVKARQTRSATRANKGWKKRQEGI